MRPCVGRQPPQSHGPARPRTGVLANLLVLQVLGPGAMYMHFIRFV